jgi:transposase
VGRPVDDGDLGLADELVGMGVVMESTSDYWRPFLYLLEASGLEVWLVDARAVKQVPGRPNTDKLDAVWLAKLNERGMLRPASCRRWRSVSCATTPRCAVTSPRTVPVTSNGWRSCSRTR